MRVYRVQMYLGQVQKRSRLARTSITERTPMVAFPGRPTYYYMHIPPCPRWVAALRYPEVRR